MSDDNLDHIDASYGTPWQPEPIGELRNAIERMQRELPGWWWSVGACHYSADASSGPDLKGPAAMLLKHKVFDEGFHADLDQPSTCGQALNNVIDQALEALRIAYGVRGK